MEELWQEEQAYRFPRGSGYYPDGRGAYTDTCHEWGVHKNPDMWFLDKLARRAMRLWRGEQIDGSFLLWGVDESGALIQPREILTYPTAVMAGWRFLTSLRSTPRYLRAPMHVSLDHRSWREFYDSGRGWHC